MLKATSLGKEKKFDEGEWIEPVTPLPRERRHTAKGVLAQKTPRNLLYGQRTIRTGSCRCLFVRGERTWSVGTAVRVASKSQFRQRARKGDGKRGGGEPTLSR